MDPGDFFLHLRSLVVPVSVDLIVDDSEQTVNIVLHIWHDNSTFFELESQNTKITVQDKHDTFIPMKVLLEERVLLRSPYGKIIHIPRGKHDYRTLLPFLEQLNDVIDQDTGVFT